MQMSKKGHRMYYWWPVPITLLRVYGVHCSTTYFPFQEVSEWWSTYQVNLFFSGDGWANSYKILWEYWGVSSCSIFDEPGDPRLAPLGQWPWVIWQNNQDHQSGPLTQGHQGKWRDFFWWRVYYYYTRPSVWDTLCSFDRDSGASGGQNLNASINFPCWPSSRWDPGLVNVSKKE